MRTLHVCFTPSFVDVCVYGSRTLPVRSVSLVFASAMVSYRVIPRIKVPDVCDNIETPTVLTPTTLLECVTLTLPHVCRRAKSIGYLYKHDWEVYDPLSCPPCSIDNDGFQLIGRRFHLQQLPMVSTTTCSRSALNKNYCSSPSAVPADRDATILPKPGKAVGTLSQLAALLPTGAPRHCVPKDTRGGLTVHEGCGDPVLPTSCVSEPDVQIPVERESQGCHRWTYCTACHSDGVNMKQLICGKCGSYRTLVLWNTSHRRTIRCWNKNGSHATMPQSGGASNIGMPWCATLRQLTVRARSHFFGHRGLSAKVRFTGRTPYVAHWRSTRR